MSSQIEPSLWISAASFVVSGIALGWTMYRDLADRGRLRVSCHIGKIAQLGVGIVEDNLLFWTATNVGRQPVIVASYGGVRAKSPRTWQVLTQKLDPLPKTLRPGEVFSGCSPIAELQPDITELWVFDTLGKKYRAPRKQVRQVIKELVEWKGQGTAGGQNRLRN